MDEIECVVVGAGVVGLAVARALACAGREVVVLEQEGLVGSHTSSRNSEVIHAGIYYPRGSAKARLCLRGRELLYGYCASRAVPHARLGKIIVATGAEQAGALAGIAAAAAANGVDDLAPLDAAGLAALEPRLRGVAGLLSPSTGIIDSHALMLSYQGEAEDRGAAVAFRTRFLAARPRGAGLEVEAASGPGPHAERLWLRTRLLVNAAGLFAGRAAAAVEGLARPARPRGALLQGQLLRAGRAPALRPPDLSGARARRPGRAPDARPGRPRPLRPGHRMDRRARLRPRPEPRARLLRRDPPLLAGAARRGAAARLCRHPPQAPPRRRPGHRLRDRGPGDARGGGPRQPLRHREPRADRLARHRRGGAGPRRH